MLRLCALLLGSGVLAMWFCVFGSVLWQWYGSVALCVGSVFWLRCSVARWFCGSLFDSAVLRFCVLVLAF